MLLQLADLMNLILVLSCPINIQGQEPYLGDFVFVFVFFLKPWLAFKQLQIDFFKHDMLFDTVELTSFIPV